MTSLRFTRLQTECPRHATFFPRVLLGGNFDSEKIRTHHEGGDHTSQPFSLDFPPNLSACSQSPPKLLNESKMADDLCTPETTSSSTGTSSSSQNQSVPSSASMDSGSTAPTLPTQDIVDGMSDEEEMKISNWGRLFPLGIGFEKIGELLCL